MLGTKEEAMKINDIVDKAQVAATDEMLRLKGYRSFEVIRGAQNVPPSPVLLGEDDMKRVRTIMAITIHNEISSDPIDTPNKSNVPLDKILNNLSYDQKTSLQNIESELNKHEVKTLLSEMQKSVDQKIGGKNRGHQDYVKYWDQNSSTGAEKREETIKGMKEDLKKQPGILKQCITNIIDRLRGKDTKQDQKTKKESAQDIKQGKESIGKFTQQLLEKGSSIQHGR